MKRMTYITTLLLDTYCNNKRRILLEVEIKHWAELLFGVRGNSYE